MMIARALIFSQCVTAKVTHFSMAASSVLVILKILKRGKYSEREEAQLLHPKWSYSTHNVVMLASPQQGVVAAPFSVASAL